MQVKIRRVYSAAQSDEGLVVLVDRLWPRGVSKEKLSCDIWAKDVAPSNELRVLLHSNPQENWSVFARQYRKELQESEAFALLLKEIRDLKVDKITLLYASKDKKEIMQ